MMAHLRILPVLSLLVLPLFALLLLPLLLPLTPLLHRLLPAESFQSSSWLCAGKVRSCSAAPYGKVLLTAASKETHGYPLVPRAAACCCCRESGRSGATAANFPCKIGNLLLIKLGQSSCGHAVCPGRNPQHERRCCWHTHH